MAATDAAVAAAAGAAGGGGIGGGQPGGTTPPGQQQMPQQGNQQVLPPPGIPAIPVLPPTIEQLMWFLVAQSQQMAEMMKTFSADKSSGKYHLASARLDERNFRRIKDFTNKREDL